MFKKNADMRSNDNNINIKKYTLILYLLNARRDFNVILCKIIHDKLGCL